MRLYQDTMLPRRGSLDGTEVPTGAEDIPVAPAATAVPTMIRNANPLVRLRVNPPEKFDPTTNFEKYARRLKAYMGMTDKRFTKLMDWAAKQTDEIDLEVASLEIGETLDGEGTGMATSLGDTEMLASTLNYVLIELLEGVPANLLDNNEDMNGLEVWRRLVDRYGKTRTHLALLGLKLGRLSVSWSG